MYFDEEVVLEIRLNTLDKYVDYFVIVESNFTHKGDKRTLRFNHNKFEKFKDKIIYLVYEEEPKNIHLISGKENENRKSFKYIMNALYRENGQRNHINNGLTNAKENDLIMISDVDEIPKLNDIDFSKIDEKIISFKQDMFYYKLDLVVPNFKWTGTKACKLKNFLGPQWLRNVKDKKYAFYRLDTLFSKKKYRSIKIIEDGGWHFSNIKTAKEIEHKLRSYLHHREFDLASLSINEINNIMENKQAIYDLRVDKNVNKVGSGSKLIKLEFKKLPVYIQENKEMYNEWLD
tara:strand:+ start:586 stop:1455 length:870 start_codon:yes stop_codon:yes gene_type:complete